MGFIQIFGVLFALFAISRVILRYKDRKSSLSSMAVWVLVWMGVILVAVLPQTASFVARLFGIGRGIDVVLYLSIILLYYLIYRLYAKMEDTKKDLTSIVRELALKGKKRE